MNQFCKQEAIAVIEDALSSKDAFGAGVVAGLSGAFHMVGLLTKEEMEYYTQLAPLHQPIEQISLH